MSAIGGANLNDTTYRVLKAVISDDLAQKFSYAGQTGKSAFGTTILKSCVCGKDKEAISLLIFIPGNYNGIDLLFF